MGSGNSVRGAVCACGVAVHCVRMRVVHCARGAPLCVVQFVRVVHCVRMRVVHCVRGALYCMNYMACSKLQSHCERSLRFGSSDCFFI